MRQLRRLFLGLLGASVLWAWAIQGLAWGADAPDSALSPATKSTLGSCLASPSPSVTTQIQAGATPTFGIFATGRESIPFVPATNRVFVRFKDGSGLTRGSTSVAVRTQ